MLTTLALAALLAVPSAGTFVTVCVDDRSMGPDEHLRTLFLGGRSYVDFLEAATRRTELWHGNTAKAASIDPALVARARAVGGTWRFLAVAVDSCSDSVSTIPYLAQLVSMVDGVDMRVIGSRVGRTIMEAHRTPDGRPATPTVLLLDDGYDEVGCFIERPPTLQAWILENDDTVTGDDIYEWKMKWYADDSGQETLESFVAMLEAAATGAVVCGQVPR